MRRYLLILAFFALGCIGTNFDTFEYVYPPEPFSATVTFHSGEGQTFEVNIVDLSRTQPKPADEQLEDFVNRRKIIISTFGMNLIGDESIEVSGIGARRLTATLDKTHQYVHIVYPENQKYYEIVYSLEDGVFSENTATEMIDSINPKIGGFTINYPRGWTVSEDLNDNY